MILTHSAAKILSEYIIGKGYGVRPGNSVPKSSWMVGPNKMPEDSELIAGRLMISTFDRKADQNTVNMQTGERGEFWGWQILVRGMTDEAAEAKLIQIGRDFDALYKYPLSIDSSTYIIHRIRRTMQPLFLKQQEKANMRIWTMEGYVSIYLQGT